MTRATGYILKLDSDRQIVFEEELSFSDLFAEPVADFEHSRNVPLVCFISDANGSTKYLALGARGHRAGTGLRRLNLSEIKELQNAVDLRLYANGISKRFRRHVLSKLKNGGLLTPKQFEALVDSIVASDGDLARLLRRYSSVRAKRIGSLSSEAKRELAYQKEAVTTALAIAGYDRSPLQSWDPPIEGAPSSFLEGISEVRLREDPMIVQDFTNVPGFELVKTLVHGAAVFEGPDRTTLTVILANRLPLEQLTGADLIYYNERYKSFVMVQYKAMERASGSEPIFRLPNAQLEEEVKRMDGVLDSLVVAEKVKDHLGFRFSSNPFFLKFCSRVVFDPDDVSLVPGMYIPLGQWKLLANDESLEGSRGGKGVTFRNIMRHIDNTSFIALVSNAWIGTTPDQSGLLAKAIKETIEAGRAAVIAIHTPPANKPEVETVGDAQAFLEPTQTGCGSRSGSWGNRERLRSRNSLI